MLKTIEVLRAARQRINPEGLAISLTLAYTSPAVIVPLEAGLTYVIHEIGKGTDPNLLRLTAIGVFGLASAISVATEARALRVQEYSASPTASLLNVLTGRPFLAALGGHLFNYTQLLVLNPINMVAIISADGRLLAESVGSTSLALTLWLTTMNSLISAGRIQPVVEKIRAVRQSIMKIVRK